jgi:hypothetical protein
MASLLYLFYCQGLLAEKSSRGLKTYRMSGLEISTGNNKKSTRNASVSKSYREKISSINEE